MKDIYKAAGNIIVNRKVLVERSKGKKYFVHPGGKIEPGETAKQALVRELKEEFSIEVKEADLVPFDQGSAAAANNPEAIVHMEVFTVTRWVGELKPDNEVEEIFWLSSEIPQGMNVGSIMAHQTLPKLKAAGLID